MANRPKMDPADRAKQFLPFDALKGFREALAEKERTMVPQGELEVERDVNFPEEEHALEEENP